MLISFYFLLHNQDCFRPGCGVQIRSKCSGGCLRALPNGEVDCLGTVGNDYSGENSAHNWYSELDCKIFGDFVC